MNLFPSNRLYPGILILPTSPCCHKLGKPAQEDNSEDGLLSPNLFIAFIVLSLVFWKFLKLTNIRINQINIKLNLIKFFLLLLFLQLIIGAFVSGMDAGKIYNTWPLMGSSFFPDDSVINDLFNLKVFDDQSLVQFIHRNLAYLIVIIYFYILYYVLKNGNIHLKTPIFILGISLLFQIFLGVFTILSGVKMLYASLHQINSILIILSTLYFLYIVKYKEPNY